jgi:WD40 repeat protein
MGKKSKIIEFSSTRSHLSALSAQGDVLAVVNPLVQKDNLALYSTETSTLLTKITTPSGPTALGWSPVSALLAVGTKQGHVTLYKAPFADNKAVSCDVAHAGQITGISFSKDGSLLATCSDETEVSVWNVAENKLLRLN